MADGKSGKTRLSWRRRLGSKLLNLLGRRSDRPRSTIPQKEPNQPPDEPLEPRVTSNDHRATSPKNLPPDELREPQLASDQRQYIAVDETSTSEPPNGSERRTSAGSSEATQNDLWDAAHSEFEEKHEGLARALHNFMEEKHDGVSASNFIQGPSNGKKIIEDLKSELDDEKARKDAGAWKVTIGTRTIILCEVVDQIVKGLEKLKDFIDHAVSYGSVEVKFPWAVFKFILQIVGLNKEQRALILVGMDAIVHAYLRSSICQELYLSIPGRQDTTDRLKTTIIDLYTVFFEFMGLTAKYQSSSWLTNTARAFTSGDLPECLDKIGKREKRLEEYAVTCERILAGEARTIHKEWFDKLTDWQNDLDHKVDRIEVGVSQLVTDLDDKNIEEILKWISPVFYETDLENAKKNRLDGTCEWLITHDAYVQWKNAPESGTLWLHGMVGAGKTNLSSKVVDDVISDGTPCAYFFCNRSEEDQRDSLRVLLSITRQFAWNGDRKQLRTCAVEAYEKKRKQGFPSARFSLKECEGLLSKLLDANPRSIIIVDGLDECCKDTRIDILKAFDRLVRDCANTVKVFVASRDDLDLKDHYQSSPNVSIKATDNRDDIEKFVRHKISEHPWASKNISSQVTQEVVRCFKTKSEGMFQWAVLHINDLLKLRNNAGILARLGQMPPDLTDAYDKIYGQLDPSLKTIATQALRWLMTPHYLLDPEMMCILVSQEPDKDFILTPTISREGFLDACRNLIKIDKDRYYKDRYHEVCRFSHLSVHEYLKKHHPELDNGEEMGLKVSLKFWKLVTTLQHADSRRPFRPFDWNAHHLRFISYPVVGLLLDWDSISDEVQQESWDILCSTIGVDGMLGDPDVVHGGPVWKAIASCKLSQTFRFLFQDGPIYACARNGNVAPIKRWISQGGFRPWKNNSTAKDVIWHAWSKFYAVGPLPRSKGCVAITNLLLDVGTSYKDEPSASSTRLLLYFCQFYYHVQQTTFQEDDESDKTEKTRNRGEKLKSLHTASSADLFESLIRLLDRIRVDGASVERTDLSLFKYNFFDAILPLEVIRWFLDNGMNVNASIGTVNPMTILTSAVKRRSRYTSNLGIVELLLKRGAEVNKPDGASETALLIAAQRPDDVETVQLLLKYGADPNQGNEFMSPLQVAARYANVETVKLLLDSKAQIQAVGIEYGTALHAAALRGSEGEEIYALLLSYDADSSIQCTVGGGWGIPSLEGQKCTAEQVLQARLEEE